MIENEIILANITNKDRVLHIGCGPIPVTSIHIAKKTGAQITGIDKNLHSVEQAQALLLRLKFSDKIQIIHADASKFSLEKFNLIIVSQGIKPYVETLKYISQVMRRDARVIFRTSSTTDGNLIEKDYFLKDIFSLKKIIRQGKNGLLISVLLFKK